MDIFQEQFDEISTYFRTMSVGSATLRDRLWVPDYTNSEAYVQSVSEHRQRLRKMLGLTELPAPQPEIMRLMNTGRLSIELVSLPLDRDFNAVALLLTPVDIKPKSAVIVVPSADETPEQIAGLDTRNVWIGWLKFLLHRGVATCIPNTVLRHSDWDSSGPDRVDRRHVLHRFGFVVGRTVTGLEVQQVLALRQWLASRYGIEAKRTGIIGREQGGMTALFAGALDQRLGAVAVIDYFQQRENPVDEPLDRMLYGRLNEFGDAELAALIAPRPLTIICTPQGPTPAESVEAEGARARTFYEKLGRASFFAVKHVYADDALHTAASDMALALGVSQPPRQPVAMAHLATARIERSREEHFDGLCRYLHRLCEESHGIRESYWNLANMSTTERPETVQRLREKLTELIGVIPPDDTALSPVCKVIRETETFTAYDVLLSVRRDLHAYGQLMLPKQAGGRRPVVICQHGWGGSPRDFTGLAAHGEDSSDPRYDTCAARLIRQGCVVFAPYVATSPVDPESSTTFNPVVRQSAALGKWRISIELAKLQRIIDYLQSRAQVDGESIGYYGMAGGDYGLLCLPSLENRIRVSVFSGVFDGGRNRIIAGANTEEPHHRDADGDLYAWQILQYFTHSELLAAMWPQPVCIEWAPGNEAFAAERPSDAASRVEKLIHSWSQDNSWDALFIDPRVGGARRAIEFLEERLLKGPAAEAPSDCGGGVV